METCVACGGNGFIWERLVSLVTGEYEHEAMICLECGGSGEVGND